MNFGSEDELIEKFEGIDAKGNLNIVYLNVETEKYSQRGNNKANSINYSLPFFNGTINYSFYYKHSQKKGQPYEVYVDGKIPSDYNKSYDKITLQEIKSIEPANINLTKITWFDEETKYIGMYFYFEEEANWVLQLSVHKEQIEKFNIYFKNFFETNIKGREHEYAKEVLENNMADLRKK